jgi:invasion protein IalB
MGEIGVMRRLLPLVVTLGSVLVAGDADTAPFYLQDLEAQQAAPLPSTPKTDRSSQVQPSPSSNAPSAAAPPARVLRRSESEHFDNWVVNCQEFTDTPKKRTCDAQLKAEQSGDTRIIFIWTMYISDSKQLVGVLQTLTGVMIAPGVEVELGQDNEKDKAKEKKAAVWKFVYESCEPTRCLATLNLDNTFIRDATATPMATVTIRAINGNTVRLNFPIKGIDKAYAQLRANAG